MGQTIRGGVDGTVTRADSATAIPFVLIKLLPAGASTTGAVRERLTDAAGRFRFSDLPAGDYTLQLLRIGYRPVSSPTLTVADGQTLRHDMRVVPQPIVLATVNVRSTPACLTAAQLPSEPPLFTLWTEARRNVETRRAFELQYRYVRVLRQDIEVEWRFRPNSKQLRQDTLRSEPDSVIPREARARAAARARGYGQGTTLVVPNEKELLDETFLTDHCLETDIRRANGALGIHFRPMQRRENGFELGGTIWVDENTFVMRSLDLEHWRGNRRAGQSRLDYGQITIDGSTLYVPVSGYASVRASGGPRAIVSGATAELRFIYSNFAALR